MATIREVFEQAWLQAFAGQPRDAKGRFASTGAGAVGKGKIAATYLAVKQAVETGDLHGRPAHEQAKLVLDRLEASGAVPAGERAATETALRTILSTRSLNGITPLSAEAKKAVLEDRSVNAAAAKFGVEPGEVRAAIGLVAGVKAKVREEALQASLDAFHTLDSAEAVRIAKPGGKGGETDWFRSLDKSEQARIRKGMGGEDGADVIADRLRQKGLASESDTDTDVMENVWLPLNRQAHAGAQLARGHMPHETTTGGFDPDTLVTGDYKPSKLFGTSVSLHEQAGHVAAVNKQQRIDEAYRQLGKAADPVEGPPAWKMSPDTYRSEVSSLEYSLRTQGKNSPVLETGERGVNIRQARARYRELVPHDLDEPGLSYGELHERVTRAARHAGLA